LRKREVSLTGDAHRSKVTQIIQANSSVGKQGVADRDFQQYKEEGHWNLEGCLVCREKLQGPLPKTEQERIAFKGGKDGTDLKIPRRGKGKEKLSLQKKGERPVQAGPEFRQRGDRQIIAP